MMHFALNFARKVEVKNVGCFFIYIYLYATLFLTSSGGVFMSFP